MSRVSEAVHTEHVFMRGHLLWGAESLFDLGLDLCCAVLHEDGTVGIALGHLLLSLYTPFRHCRNDLGLDMNGTGSTLRRPQHN